MTDRSLEEKRRILEEALRKTASAGRATAEPPGRAAAEAPAAPAPRPGAGGGSRASRLRRFFAHSDHAAARAVRTVYHGVNGLSVPAPRVVVKPLLWAFLAVRAVYYFVLRVFVCEPLFKAYCRRYGRRLRTGVHVHWVQGAGDLVVGDDVTVDGKCSFQFASRFSASPTLAIGDGTLIGHNCTFTVAVRITIGRRVRIASDVWMFDSSGHPLDAAARRAGLPPQAEAVRPITVGDNVWIGRRCVIFPGVSIGEGCIIAAGSVVMASVPPHTVVAGNPAKRIANLAES